MNLFFKIAGISWNALTRNWIDQCYFNVLEWSELCNFLAMAVLFPPEHVLYYLICTAQHLQARFLNTFISNDITTYQKVTNHNFSLKYILTHMFNFSF